MSRGLGDRRRGAWARLRPCAGIWSAAASATCLPCPGTTASSPGSELAARSKSPAASRKRASQRLSAGSGAKGQRVYDWAQVTLTGDDPGQHRLLMRRNRSTGEVLPHLDTGPGEVLPHLDTGPGEVLPHRTPGQCTRKHRRDREQSPGAY